MPTSPLNEVEIEAVFGDAPSASALEAAGRLPAADMRGEWKRLAMFLRRPSLDVSAQNGSPFTVLARIYALDMMAMLILITIASAAIAAGFYLPKTALADTPFTPLIVFMVIVGAPVLEELGFRSWLSGKPGHVGALALFGLGAAGFAFTHAAAPLLGGLVLAGALIGAGAALVFLRKRPPMRWFAALFPGFFWFSTLAFALVHLANFDALDGWGSLGILLPLVLPQLILGGLLGYIRVRIGLWAAMLLHAVHNATALGIAAIAMGMEMGMGVRVGA